MASNNLAAKYRPKTFTDVVEQDIVTELLKKICESDSLPSRNFLLVGSPGVGKTTSARAMAAMLNGNSDSTIEVDAASNNGVDAMRRLVAEASSYPIGTKYKIIIVDEVHVISQQGWQVLLKPLEEGVGRTIWIMCTTNPEKIPATILSRVQTFQLSKISLSGIENRLKYIIEQENAEGANITATPDAVNYIAKLANGGMRDAITLLEKAIAYTSNLTSETLSKALNLPNYDDYFELLNAIAKKDNAKIAGVIHQVYNSGVNFVKWFDGFHSFVCNIVKYIFLRDISKTMIPSHYQDKIKNYGPAHSTLCLKLANKLVKMNQELRTTQYLQELALTYLCSIPQGGPK